MGFLACQQISSQTSDTKSVRPEHTVGFLVPSFSTEKTQTMSFFGTTGLTKWCGDSFQADDLCVQGYLGLDDDI